MVIGHGVSSPPQQRQERGTQQALTTDCPLPHDLGSPRRTNPRAPHGSCPESCPGHTGSSKGTEGCSPTISTFSRVQLSHGVRLVSQ